MANNSINKIDYDKVYHTNNYGDFVFLQEVEPYRYTTSYGRPQTERMAKIRFLQTNTEIIVRVRDAIAGRIKDPYYPKICGVAYTGNTYTNKDHKFFYDKWRAMIDRCYNKNNSNYKYYKNHSVDPEWLCFENFLRDVPLIAGYHEMIANRDKIKYSLDKDILQPRIENKIYSKNTCMWIPLSENSMYAAITYKDSKKDASSKYYGVTLDRGNYKVQPSVKDTYMNPVGSYTDEIAAVNMREYFRKLYHPNVIPNEDYPYMPLNEAIKYKCTNKKRKPLFKSDQPNQVYYGVEPENYTNNKWIITDVFYNGKDLGVFVNLDAVLSVREYYRAIYYPYLPKNYNYNHIPIQEAMRFKFHKENPKLLFKVEDNK